MLQLAVKALGRHHVLDHPHKPQEAHTGTDEGTPTTTTKGAARKTDDLTPCPRHPQTPSDLCGRCCVRTFDQLHNTPQDDPETTTPPNQATDQRHQFAQNLALQAQLQAVLNAGWAPDLTDATQRTRIAQVNRDWVNSRRFNLPNLVTHLASPHPTIIDDDTAFPTLQYTTPPNSSS